MMRNARIVTVAVVAFLMVGTGAMAVTEPTDTVAQIDLRGYYVDAGVDVDINELERLVASTPGGSGAVFLVALADDPAEGADLFATDVLGLIEGEGTVLVVSPGEIGARSTAYGDQQISNAVDASLDAFNRSYADGLAVFADALRVSGGEGGGGGVFVFLLIVLGIGALLFFMIRRGKKRRQEAFADRIDEIKTEVRGQLGEVADDILELEDEVLLSDNEQAKEMYATGSKSYAEFEERLDGATTLEQLHDLVDGLDTTQWQLEAAEALLDGNPLPPRPEHADHQPEAAALPPNPPQLSGRAELPPDLQMRRERGQRMPTGESRPRQRTGGWLGGLGTAAVILNGLQQGSRNRRPRARSGVTVPNVGGRRSTSRSGRSSTRSSRSSSPGGKTMRGRARRKR